MRSVTLILALVVVTSCTAGREEVELPENWTEPFTGMEFVLIRQGTFLMGSPEDEPDREDREILHRVTITRPFYIGRQEVTGDEWARIVGSNPAPGGECGPRCPVVNVSMEDIRVFLDRLNARAEGALRLPTEAEWEYACRAGTITAFSTGDTLGSDEALFDGDGPPHPTGPLPVGSFPANPWGLHDMHGNVWEWCEDRICPYDDGPVTDPIGTCEDPRHVIRGGSWHFGADSARCALRYTHHPEDLGPSLGFRLVRDVVQKSAR